MRIVRKKGLSVIASGRRLILVATFVLVLLGMTGVIQIGTTLAQGANPARDLPDAPVQRGETFDVTITFIAPDDDFNSIGLTDSIPSNWDVQVDTSWCTPNADFSNIVGDEAQYVWNGPYDSGQAFTAIYQVTIPSGASLGTHLFSGQLEYYENSSGPFIEDIGGDSSIDVTGTAPSPTPIPTWTFSNPGFFPKHLPDSYYGQLVLSNIDLGTIPGEVQGVYWFDCIGMEWKFWAPGVPGTTLTTLGGGHTYDYMVAVTGNCDWEIPLP